MAIGGSLAALKYVTHTPRCNCNQIHFSLIVFAVSLARSGSVLDLRYACTCCTPLSPLPLPTQPWVCLCNYGILAFSVSHFVVLFSLCFLFLLLFPIAFCLLFSLPLLNDLVLFLTFLLRSPTCNSHFYTIAHCILFLFYLFCIWFLLILFRFDFLLPLEQVLICLVWHIYPPDTFVNCFYSAVVVVRLSVPG